MDKTHRQNIEQQKRDTRVYTSWFTFIWNQKEAKQISQSNGYICAWVSAERGDTVEMLKIFDPFLVMVIGVYM